MVSFCSKHQTEHKLKIASFSKENLKQLVGDSWEKIVYVYKIIVSERHAKYGYATLDIDLD